METLQSTAGSLSLSLSFLADKEEEEVEERRKPSGQAW